MGGQRLREGARSGGKERRSPEALFAAGLRHFESGRLGAAEERCRQALAADPGRADCLHLLGLILAQAGKPDQAIDSVALAIRSNPKVPAYFASLGMLLQRQGRFVEALKSYDLALKLRPDDAEVWTRLGDLLRRQHRFDGALLTFDHALSLEAGHAEAVSKAAVLLLELGRFMQALAKFDLLETIRPGQFETAYNRGMCLAHLARWEEAEASFRKAVAVAPGNAAAHHELGQALLESNRGEEALAHLRKAVELDPGFVAALNNLGNALVGIKQPDEALALFDRAIALAPDTPELFSNKANAEKALGRFDEALAGYDRAIALKPGYVQAHSNRGTCLDHMMRPDEARAAYAEALALAPEDAQTHWNLAINRLRAGDFTTGWTEAEWRWKCPENRLTHRQFEKPLWLGVEPVDGRTLLLHNDQGLGDAIQFCRYAPLLAARGARVVLEVDRPLHGLLSRLSGVAQLVVKGEPLPDFDLHCPFMSLPLAFSTALETIPSTVPYLSAVGSARDWEELIGPRRRPRIGLVWSGSATHSNDRDRSIALATLLPLLDADAQFISLQKELRPADQAVLRQRDDLIDAGPHLRCFADTAALMGELDLVISVDTSVAHLAGALGRPCWLLLPWVPDWRWLTDRTDSPWYPTLRLFRQTAARDWGVVIGEVRDALQGLADARRAGSGAG